jgi:hypothetical protein
MRQECELCGEYAICEDGVCNDCRLEKTIEEDKDYDSSSKEGEGEKETAKEAETTNTRGSS